MLITPFCFAISSVMGSVQQAFNRFIFYAFASVFYNLGIIFGIMFLAPAHSIYGVAYGVVIGAGLQTLLQIVGLAGLGYRYRLTLGLKLKGVVKIFKLMIPRSIDQSIDQINYTVETVIGSRLAAGSLTAYYYANNLKNVPLAIFGTSIATAAFPRLAASAAGRDKTRLIEGFVSSMRLILFLVIPAGIIAFLMRGYIVRLLFGFGSSVTAQTLGWFAGTIIFQSLFFLVSRVFYALQDTKTPLYASLVAISLNIFLSLILSTRYGVVGLAMSQSVIAAFETLLLLWLLRPRLGSLGGRGAVKAVGQMLIAGLIMASVLYIMISRVLPLYLLDRGYFIVGPKFVLILAAGLVAYLGPSYLMGLREAKQLVRRAADQLRRPITYLGLQ
jgi:putative peptidoglycan lipid II flippase